MRFYMSMHIHIKILDTILQVFHIFHRDLKRGLKHFAGFQQVINIFHFLFNRKMTTRSHAEFCDILDDNGPELLERIELSERFYQCLTSEEVVQDRTLIRDLEVGENIKVLYLHIMSNLQVISVYLIHFKPGFSI